MRAPQEGMPRLLWRLMVIGLVGALALLAWVRLSPAESALQLGQWALEAGDPHRADVWFQRFVRERRGSAGSLAEVGQRYLAARQWERAAEYLEETVSRDPRHPSRVLLGLAYENLGRDDEAEQVYRQALRLFPSHPLVLNALGYFYAQRAARLDEAVDLLHRALELAPMDGAILDSLGWALYQRGDLLGALANLSAAVEQLPDSGEVRYHLAMALARNAQRDRARVELGKAVMLEPWLPGVREAQRCVRDGWRPPVPLPLRHWAGEQTVNYQGSAVRHAELRSSDRWFASQIRR